MKILHIEDNRMVIELVKSMLKENDFRFCESLGCVKLIDLKWADLIFLDLKLDPSSVELEGIKVLDIIRKTGLEKKVVLLSALPEEAKKAKIKYKELVIGIINKPFLKADLIKYVKNGVKK